ncbi:MAG: flagellar export chaperone FliS [candidate division Zixibacteria bacterium]
MTKKNIDTYLKMKISDMNPRELIVFMYESTINLMEESKETIKNGDLQGTHTRLNRARNVFLHLLGTLNIEEGGDIAARLSSLYAYFIEKITMANTTKDPELLDEIIPLVVEIKDSWENMELDAEESKSPKTAGNIEGKLVSVEA